MLTVPQNPVREDAERGVDAVLKMPFTGFDLTTMIRKVHEERGVAASRAGSLMVSLFSPKGGVGRTTLAYNLAVALAATPGETEHKVCLVDGSLQFSDLRGLLRVPAVAPSIVNLPTDRVRDSDLAEIMWRDPSGIDILLAPPRVEMAEMVTTRDVDKVLSLLRRIYGVVVIDLSSHLNEVSLAFLDTSDTILEIVTYDSTTIHNTIAMADTFRAIGYPAAKVQYLVNRADSPGGIDPQDLERALGRVPEHRVVSDGRLVIQANNEGVPFVLAEPAAAISQDMDRIARELLNRVPVAASAGRR
jgi:pilus assembly protein CpaE